MMVPLGKHAAKHPPGQPLATVPLAGVEGLSYIRRIPAFAGARAHPLDADEPMKTRWIPAIAVVLALSGCSSKDDPTGPDPAPVPPTIEEFVVSTGGPVRHGDFAKLFWTAPNAETAAITGIGTVSPAADGSATIRPAFATTYTLTVHNSVGSATATITVDVEYLPGLYVNGTSGADSASGSSPLSPFKTLDEALDRVGSGGAIFITGSKIATNGIYATAIDLDGKDVSIYGGRDPATFFANPSDFPTRIFPTSGVPLVLRNTLTMQQYFDLIFDASNGGPHAALVADAGAMFQGCIFEGDNSATGTAISVEGLGRVVIDASRIRGGRDRLYTTTAGIRSSALSDLQVTNTFIDGGRANDTCSGVEVRGTARLGFNTILVEVTSSGALRNAACVRIAEAGAAVAIGGNILMGQGAGQRVGVVEGIVGADPSWLEGNLFVSLSTPPYLNAAGSNPTSEDQLNDPSYTTLNVGGNYWSQNVGAPAMFENFAGGDFHLVDPLPGGGDNPAIDRGDSYVGRPEYGSVKYDVDGDRRPSAFRNFDLGADEL